MAEREHDRIIAAQAKDALEPIGFRRQGRSRVWLADHGWWLGVVEFQPSSFSKGTYCNVAIHWLWSPLGVLSFDSGHDRVGDFAAFKDVERFTSSVRSMATEAARRAEIYRETLTTPVAAAAWAVEFERLRGDWDLGGWAAFNAGVASGLADDVGTARLIFERLLAKDEGSLDWQIARAHLTRRLLAALIRRDAFLELVQPLIDDRRAAEKLLPFFFR